MLQAYHELAVQKRNRPGTSGRLLPIHTNLPRSSSLDFLRHGIKDGEHYWDWEDNRFPGGSVGSELASHGLGNGRAIACIFRTSNFVKGKATQPFQVLCTDEDMPRCSCQEQLVIVLPGSPTSILSWLHNFQRQPIPLKETHMRKWWQFFNAVNLNVLSTVISCELTLFGHVLAASVHYSQIVYGNITLVPFRSNSF